MARRRRSSRRHSRALGMYHHRMGNMSAFSFDTAQIHWGAVGAGVIAGAALAYYWMKPKPSSSPMSGLGAKYQPPDVGAIRKKLCKENPRYSFC